MRKVRKAGVSSWPVIRGDARKARVSLKARTLSAPRLAWWQLGLRLVRVAAKLGMIACAVSLFMPELLFISDAPQRLILCLAVFILSKQQLAWLGRIFIGQTTLIEWDGHEVIIYRSVGWRMPVRIRRDGLTVRADLQPMRDELELCESPLAAAAYDNAHMVTLHVGNRAQNVVSVWGRHAQLLVSGILNAEQVHQELSQARKQKRTAQFSTAE
ncbi:MAG: hypothetical protein KDN22_10990 [Verrucomicrobiae bacterium]|nr:hypothetical protein [Verrucomicrobiae bacterium]